MDLSKLRRYDVQAGWSMALSAVSIIPLVCALMFTWQRYDPVLGRIIYGSEGKFVPVLLASVMASMLPSALGFVLGLSSAGQRRNDKPWRSWFGFFIGGTVMTVNLILLIAFFMLRLEQPM